MTTHNTRLNGEAEVLRFLSIFIFRALGLSASMPFVTRSTMEGVKIPPDRPFSPDSNLVKLNHICREGCVKFRFSCSRKTYEMSFVGVFCGQARV